MDTHNSIDIKWVLRTFFLSLRASLRFLYLKVSLGTGSEQILMTYVLRSLVTFNRDLSKVLACEDDWMLRAVHFSRFGHSRRPCFSPYQLTRRSSDMRGPRPGPSPFPFLFPASEVRHLRLVISNSSHLRQFAFHPFFPSTRHTCAATRLRFRSIHRVHCYSAVWNRREAVAG
ncbi:hypothetical protein H4582DRAFT_1422682 [Lactarius indigo]|nr:hypothetical protein H4582DRAFT_1422682 [Lactarius indigo]